jgi:hypothetical protein
MIKRLTMKEYDFKEFEYTSIWREHGSDIVFWKYVPNLEMDISIAKKLVADRLDYTEGKSVFALIDATNLKSGTKEARQFMSDPEGGLKGIAGGAFISNNAFANIIINLYLRINKPSVPARFFTTREDALEWINRIRSPKAIL